MTGMYGHVIADHRFVARWVFGGSISSRKFGK